MGMMNLKYNRIDMKNEGKAGKMSLKPRGRPSKPTKSKLTRKRTGREKRSPSTREFGTDLTNRPEPVATEAHSLQEGTSPSPSEIAPYLPSIIQHLIDNDYLFTSKITNGIISHPDFGHSKISTEMRKVLLKWLLQVSRKFQVKDETMQICVQIIDYMLLFQSSIISKTNFQLLGVAALFVASKYNEIHTFQADKYVYLCDGLYTMAQLFEMQSLILTTTNFNLQFPTLNQFTGLLLQHYELKLDITVSQLAQLTMLDSSLSNRYRKQHLASVIIYFAAKLHESSLLRSKNIIEELGVPEDIFRECSAILFGLYRSKEEQK